MKILLAPTEDFIKLERTTLTADAAKGSNVSLSLANTTGMAEDTYIVVGREGSEPAELCQINQAPDEDSARVATLVRDHKAGEPVTVYRFNKRKFYGATSAGGSYTELTDDGSPKDIQVDDPQGTYLEYTGDEGYTYFKATYLNVADATETDTDESDAVLADESKRYCSIYGIRKMAGLTENPYITDGRIEDKRKQAENEVDSSIMQRYVLPLAEVPALITYVTECLAAGYIGYEEYGPEADTNKKLGEARGILKAIADGKQRLLGADKVELAVQRSAFGISGKPNGSETGGSKRKFSMGQKF